jgi:CubicO group peptidase (beta-lactamase class C family)
MQEIYIDGGIEGDPEKVGINKAGLEDVIRLLREQVKNGLHTGAQLHIARNGETVLNLGIGEARPGIPMRRDAVILLYSSTKPWVAVAIAQLWESGKIRMSQKVKSIIPEFRAGKEDCEIRHVLTHTGGFPMLTYQRKPGATKDDYIQDICNYKSEYKPGTRMGYHPGSGYMILGEIVSRIDGRPIEIYLKEEILKPIGMKDASLGVSEARIKELGDKFSHKNVPPNRPDLQIAWENVPTRIKNPSGSGYSSAYEMGIFYKMLWNKGIWNGSQILSRKTVEFITDVQLKGIFDQTMGFPMVRGYGFGLGKACGSSCSRKSFGHGGAGSCKNYCDPELDLIVNFNSCTRLTQGENDERHEVINRAIYNACRFSFK